MSDLTVVTNAPKIMNPELTKLTNILFSLDATIKAKQFDIAAILGKIEVKQLYTDDGFSSCAEYAMATFGMSKTTAYELITIGKDYLRPIMSDKGKVIGHCSNLVPAAHPDKQDRPLADFSMSQLSRLIRLGREKVVELVSNGTIKPSMTVIEIQAIVKANKAKKITTEPTEPTEPTEQIEDKPVNTERGDGFDNIPTNILIAELNLRGFTVYKDGKELRYHWGN